MKGKDDMDQLTMIGQRLAFGFSGTSLPEDFRNIVRENKIGNVILFRNNITDAGQLRELCKEIQALILDVTGQPAFICIDQEGGMVTRLSPDLVNVPGNMAAAASGDPETAYRLACITARQLQGTGPNFNLAPALDVNSNAANPVIGVRSYGDDPYRAAEFGAASVRGYAKCGLLCCGKHFPGHGDTAVDSHLGLPVIDKSLEDLWQNELIPFKAVIEAGIPAIMSSHILFPQIEPKRIPATMSRRIMYDLLRGEMGFKGLILSDAMEMAAIRKHYGTAFGIAEAMKAGVDLIFLCSDPDLQRESIRFIRSAAEKGEISMEEMSASCERIIAAKAKYAFTQPEPGLAGLPDDFDTARETAYAAAVLYSGKHHALRKDTFFCGPRDYRMTNAANDESHDFTRFMEDRFGMPGRACSVDPSDDEIRMIIDEAKKHAAIVLGTCNAHLYRGQLALAAALAETGNPMTVIALRNPYDLPELPDCEAKAAVFDYNANGLAAAAEFLVNGTAPGQMPVRL